MLPGRRRLADREPRLLACLPEASPRPSLEAPAALTWANLGCSRLDNPVSMLGR